VPEVVQPRVLLQRQREVAMVDFDGLMESPQQIRVRGELGQQGQHLGDL
jgi:hypothetical protein